MRKRYLEVEKGSFNLKEVAAAGRLFDKSTETLAEIKRHINFTVPDRPHTKDDATNLVGQVYPPTSKSWENDQKHNTKVLRAVATSPAAFAKESSAWARTFGDFLFRDKPSGVDDVTFLKELRDQAASRAADHCQSQPPRETLTSYSTPLRVRQEIWTALCPGRQCVGGYPFEVPVPLIAQLKAHVIDDLEDGNLNGNTGQRLPLANYIHPHVTISLAQRERPDGEPVRTLVLGLTESTSTLSFSRLGLLQAYDMAVCWASKVDKDGVSFSLRSAFDGCNAITKSFAADPMRIKEMAELEKQIERLAPQCSQSDIVMERVKEWMEKSRYKAQYTSREAWSDTLRKWWEDEHDDVGGLGREELKEACLQAIKAKMEEWKKEKRSISETDSDVEIIESPPKKKVRSH
ncbi:hypothetical protein BDP55DRAFT_751373 [Colletotrichum godetiae]|uniref:Uncharacterized protein n=1 Tax=Colletotrichum godetiae TaxID=1209918 RepID=A0AAJ0AWG6_9PEZI|nr:uncharacterized protein BDP55DRAFT_751373 [Colletotrichum godetiae]KAK1691590.1 hypothetical protein BDP55DRAFT_751373 [Colletotrichum godetiae]